MRTIHVVFFDAGGGHRSTALALAEAIRLRQRPWRVELINLQQVLGHIDVVRKATGIYAQDVYNWSLRQGWTHASSRALPAMHGIIRLLRPRIARELSDFWRRRQPDLVVSVVPHFNRAMHKGLSFALPGIPLVTVMTDLADHPPHFWLECQDQYFICGSELAMEQAERIGISGGQVFRVSGMAIHPRFYSANPSDRGAERHRLGLEPETPTGLVLFGGYGSTVMLEIMERLAQAPPRVQLILLCGRNQRLAAILERSKAPIVRLVRTFTDDIAHYMHLSDFFIGKPGPGSVSEALAMKLPVVLERSGRTMVQERYNCDWVEQNGVGIVLEDFSQVDQGVARLLNPAVYAGFRHRIERLNNRAVFEIPEILERILGREAAIQNRSLHEYAQELPT